MHLIQPGSQPFVLAGSNGLILGIDVVQINRNSAISTGGKFLPLQWVSDFLFDFFFLLFQEAEKRLRGFSRNI